LKLQERLHLIGDTEIAMEFVSADDVVLIAIGTGAEALGVVGLESFARIGAQ
jgi:hypothetical protein